jgi:hypothetical protein
MDFLKYRVNLYRSMYQRNYVLSKSGSEGINCVRLIFEWSGGNCEKLRKKTALASLEKYFELKTGKYMNSRKRHNLKESLAQFKQFDKKTFKELYQHCTQSTIEKNNRQN